MVWLEVWSCLYSVLCCGYKTCHNTRFLNFDPILVWINTWYLFWYYSKMKQNVLSTNYFYRKVICNYVQICVVLGWLLIVDGFFYSFQYWKMQISHHLNMWFWKIIDMFDSLSGYDHDLVNAVRRSETWIQRKLQPVLKCTELLFYMQFILSLPTALTTLSA